MTKDLLRFTTAGSVDDGKSTLIGRLLHDTCAVYEDQLEADLAFLTDGLLAEREQGITIDVAYRYFETSRRKFIVADTPGHEQYTRNMATGASTAELALILIDARKGVVPQSRRHASIAALLGIRHMLVAINKMDLVEFRRDVFELICAEFSNALTRLGFVDPYFVPVSALEGDNVAALSPRMPWYEGVSLLERLETVEVRAESAGPLRFPVQMVLRARDFRGYAGLVASGTPTPGMEVLALPSGMRTRISEVQENSVIRLADEIDLGRGDMLADLGAPPTVSRGFDADLAWMSQTPLQPDATYLLKHTTRQVCAQLRAVRSVVDMETLEAIASDGRLRLNDVARVEIETHQPLYFDPYRENRVTGAFILIDMLSNQTVAAGMIRGAAGFRSQKSELRRQNGLTVWFTGLSGAGKTTICQGVRARLEERGTKVEVLDGDLVRKHLSRGLGFSREDRDENIRRIGFVAGLLTRHGVVALVAAISPYRAIRDEVRATIGNFIEVYVNAPLEVCEARDQKGLYRRARAGEIASFTGISDPYEPPLAPQVVCRTDRETVDESVGKVIRAIERALTP